MPGLLRRIRSPVGMSVLGKAAEAAGQLVVILLIPRVLGPTDYGTFAVVLSVVAIGTTALALGGPSLMARYVPATAPAQRPAVARALARRLLRWRAITLAAVSGAAIAASAVAPDLFPPVVTVLALLALAAETVATLGYQVALGLGRTSLWSFRYALQNLVLAGAVAGLFVVAGQEGAVGGIAVASGVALAVVALYVGPTLAAAPAGAGIPSGALRYSVIQGLGSMFVLVSSRGGVVAVAALAGAREAGYAHLAIGVALAVGFAVSQAFTVQLPALAAVVESEPVRAEASSRRLAEVLLVVLVPVALLAAALIDPVLRAVFGGDFTRAASAFVPALAMLPVIPLVALTGQIGALRLRPGVRARASAVGAGIFAITTAALVPAFGASGATAALLASTLATMLVAHMSLAGAVPLRLLASAIGGSAATLALGLLL